MHNIFSIRINAICVQIGRLFTFYKFEKLMSLRPWILAITITVSSWPIKHRCVMAGEGTIRGQRNLLLKVLSWLATGEHDGIKVLSGEQAGLCCHKQRPTIGIQEGELKAKNEKVEKIIPQKNYLS